MFFIPVALKICALGFSRPWRYFLHPAGCGSTFLEKNFQDTWSSNQLLRGHEYGRWVESSVGPVRSTFEAAIVRYVSFIMKNSWTHPVDWCWLQHCSFPCISSNCWYASHILCGFAGIQAVVDQICRQTKQWQGPLFGVSLALGSAFASWSSHWAGCHWLTSKIHFSSHVTISDGEMVCCCWLG